MRKNYSGKFIAKVTLDMIKEKDTVAEISSQYQVHRSLLTRWEKAVIEGFPGLFTDSKKKQNHDDQKLIKELYRLIGLLKVENDWLKKRLRESVSAVKVYVLMFLI